LCRFRVHHVKRPYNVVTSVVRYRVKREVDN